MKKYLLRKTNMSPEQQVWLFHDCIAMIDGAGIAYLRMESLASMEQDVFGVLSYGNLHIDSIELRQS